MREGNTRIRVGEDAVVIDWLMRMFPRLMYEDWFIATVLFPWMMLGRVIGAPLGRFAYPTILGTSH